MTPQHFLPVLYELVRAYQAFESYSASHIRKLGLTPSQFDIIATLGNTEGMTFKELGGKSLITKGTLTGVVDRMEAKKLVKRVACPEDGRKQYVVLTRSGKTMFAKIFPVHLAHFQQVFAGYEQQDLDSVKEALKQLKLAFQALGTNIEEAV